MRARSEYHFDCVCGAEIVSQLKEGECWECGRLFRLEWPAQIQAALRAAESKAA